MRKYQKTTITLLFLATALVLAQSAAAASFGDPNGLGSNTFDTSSAFKSLIKAIVIIAILGAAAIYVSRKVMPRVSAAMGKEIKVLETTALGPRKHLHIVKVGSQKFLLGSSADRITHLADLTDTEGTRNA
jgi:flagellar biosynthetic protein FliO